MIFAHCGGGGPSNQEIFLKYFFVVLPTNHHLCFILKEEQKQVTKRNGKSPHARDFATCLVDTCQVSINPTSPMHNRLRRPQGFGNVFEQRKNTHTKVSKTTE